MGVLSRPGRIPWYADDVFPEMVMGHTGLEKTMENKFYPPWGFFMEKMYFPRKFLGEGITSIT
jgi:hypothetical protein